MQTKQYFRVNLDAKSLHMYTKTDTFLNLFVKNLSVLLSKKKKKIHLLQYVTYLQFPCSPLDTNTTCPTQRVNTFFVKQTCSCGKQKALCLPQDTKF